MGLPTKSRAYWREGLKDERRGHGAPGSPALISDYRTPWTEPLAADLQPINEQLLRPEWAQTISCCSTSITLDTASAKERINPNVIIIATLCVVIKSLLFSCPVGSEGFAVLHHWLFIIWISSAFGDRQTGHHLIQWRLLNSHLRHFGLHLLIHYNKNVIHPV